MSTEQPLDVRGFWLGVRKHRWALLACALVGALLLGGAVLVHPPSWHSTSQVLLPPNDAGSDGRAAERDPQTFVAVATSEAVLGPVARELRAGTTVRTLQDRLSVEATSNDVLAITASGRTPRAAERLAGAVARSLLDYLTSASSSLTNAQRDSLDARLRALSTSLDQVRGQIAAARARAERQAPTSADGRATANALAQLTAQEARLVLSVDDVRQERASGPDGTATVGDRARIIQEASAGERLPLALWLLGAALLGALLGIGAALLGAAVLRRRQRRIWSRDALADAIGSPVLASVRGRTPRTVGGWTSLLAAYDPAPTDAWAWRQLLRDLLPDAAGSPASAASLGRRVRERRLLVVAFGDDPAAVGAAAQVASYAASVGVPTRLVAGQRHPAATRLWAAAARAADLGEDLRPGLRVDTDPAADAPSGTELVVLLAVLDRAEPRLELPGRADGVVVAVSPGTTTGEELAGLAVALDDAGCTVDGLVVVGADHADRTTGVPAASGGGHRGRRIAGPDGPDGTTGLALAGATDEGPSATVIPVAGRRRRHS